MRVPVLNYVATLSYITNRLPSKFLLQLAPPRWEAKFACENEPAHPANCLQSALPSEQSLLASPPCAGEPLRPADCPLNVPQLEPKVAVPEIIQVPVEETKVECKVCCGNEPLVVIFPCKHQAICKNCAEKLTNCPMCRALIESILETFQS